MASWFIPPVILPIGLAATILATIIYQAYAKSLRLRAVALAPTGAALRGKCGVRG
jgi:hypothetical protein